MEVARHKLEELNRYLAKIKKQVNNPKNQKTLTNISMLFNRRNNAINLQLTTVQ